MRVTAKTIDAVRLQLYSLVRKEIIRYDEDIPGFGVRVREDGSRVLIYQYKIGRVNRRMTLGPAVKEASGTVKDKDRRDSQAVHPRSGARLPGQGPPR
jgi:hypothetical protein